jgi:hypothetical protein
MRRSPSSAPATSRSTNTPVRAEHRRRPRNRSRGGPRAYFKDSECNLLGIGPVRLGPGAFCGGVAPLRRATSGDVSMRPTKNAWRGECEAVSSGFVRRAGVTASAARERTKSQPAASPKTNRTGRTSPPNTADDDSESSLRAPGSPLFLSAPSDNDGPDAKRRSPNRVLLPIESAPVRLAPGAAPVTATCRGVQLP